MILATSLILALIDPCTTQEFKFPEIAIVCAEEGRAGAKRLMKDIVKAAKETGHKLNCKTCHSSLKTFELKENSHKMLEKWIRNYEQNC